MTARPRPWSGRSPATSASTRSTTAGWPPAGRSSPARRSSECRSRSPRLPRPDSLSSRPMSTALSKSPWIEGRQKQLALLAAIMGSFVTGLDATAVNVALPAIRADLGGGLAGQQWVSNAYLLTLASLILVGGSLGDVYGERRGVSIRGARVWGVSVVFGPSPSLEVLGGARGLH